MTIINRLKDNLLLYGLNAYIQGSGKRQLIRIIIVFNYSGVSFLGKTPNSLFLLCRFNPITYSILRFRQLWGRGRLFAPDPENKVTVNALT